MGMGMGRQVILLLLKLVLIVIASSVVHGSAAFNISPSPETLAAPPLIKGAPGLGYDGKSPKTTSKSPAPLPNGLVSNQQPSLPPIRSPSTPQNIEGFIPSLPPSPQIVLPPYKPAPLPSASGGIVSSIPQSAPTNRAPDDMSPAEVVAGPVTLASPPNKLPENPPAMNPIMPRLLPPKLPASPPKKLPENPPAMNPIMPRLPPPKLPASPPKKLPENPPAMNPILPRLPPPKLPASPPKKLPENPPAMNPILPRLPPPKLPASPPKKLPENPPAMNPILPRLPPPKLPASPPKKLPANPPAMNPIMPRLPPPKLPASPPKKLPENPPAMNPILPRLPPPKLPASPPKKLPENPPAMNPIMPRLPPPKLPVVSAPAEPPQKPQAAPPLIRGVPPNMLPDRAASPILAPPSINRTKDGKPVAAPIKGTSDPLSPVHHSPTEVSFPAAAPAPQKLRRRSPSESSPKPSREKWIHGPASSPSISFHKHHLSQNKINSPAPAPSFLIPPTRPAPAPSFPVTPILQGPGISPVPSHPPTLLPKRNRERHHAPTPAIQVLPFDSPAPSSMSWDPPPPLPSPLIPSQKKPFPPKISPKVSSPRNVVPSPVQELLPPPPNEGSILPSESPVPSSMSRDPPPPLPSSEIPSQKKPIPPKISPKVSSPVRALPPPPPNEDCLSMTCTEPLTNTPPGSPCNCVWPMQVGLSLSVALYTFFPLVSELAEEVAAGVFLKKSQVRIMGANAASQQPDKTIVLIDLVPLGAQFDNTMAFLIYEKFWHKQVVIKTSFFGDYEVLYVRYPGLPPSPPTAPSGIANLDDGQYSDHNSNARAIKPLGVDVPHRRKNAISGKMIAIIVISSTVAVVLCLGAVWVLLSKCRDNVHPPATTSQGLVSSFAKPSGTAGPLVLGSAPSSASLSFSSSIATYTGSAKTFTASEMERATDNFNVSRVLGEGGFGCVYSGILDDGTKVAVKVLKRDDHQGGREFLAEVEMLSRLHHRNLVKLIGICTEDHIRSLVYELIPNGSVESHLHGVDKKTAPLDWGSRMKIALGAARGLAYLHEDSSPHVIHRDFKSSNILLEHDFTPKVSDFGLARTALDEENKHISTRVMGTFGYVAPEYAMTGHLLVKSDVYSYGVVLLELLTGRKPVDMSRPQGQENLVAWARPLLTSNEGLEAIVDPDLGSYLPFDSVSKVAAIASMCVQPEVSHRPFMGEVVQALKLVCNECDEAKDVGSGICSSPEDLCIDMDTKCRTSAASTQPPEPSLTRFPGPDYDSSLRTEGSLSVSEVFNTSVRFGRQESGSLRRHSSSGSNGTGRGRQFWQRVRGLSKGSMSEHGVGFRL